MHSSIACLFQYIHIHSYIAPLHVHTYIVPIHIHTRIAPFTAGMFLACRLCAAAHIVFLQLCAAAHNCVPSTLCCSSILCSFNSVLQLIMDMCICTKQGLSRLSSFSRLSSLSYTRTCHQKGSLTATAQFGQGRDWFCIGTSTTGECGHKDEIGPPTTGQFGRED
jgi:hypothetical protein